MMRTVKLAKKHGVQAGAHPGLQGKLKLMEWISFVA